MGWPGRPPGNSHGVAAGDPVPVWGRPLRMTSATPMPSGSGPATAREAGQEVCGGADVTPGVGGVGAGPGGAPCTGAQPADYLPGGVGPDQPPRRTRLDRLQDAGEPLPCAGEFFVPGRQDAACG